MSARVWLSVLAVWASAAQAPAPEKPQPKRDPRARLAEPWPGADELKKRREQAEAVPLFREVEPLAFKLSADFKAMSKDRNPKSTKRFPALLEVKASDGTLRSIPVSLRTRGHTRLQHHCDFVPIRIEFPQQETLGTPFEGQHELKLGTHCSGAQLYEQYVLREFLAYRIFHLLTPRSFRVRLAEATYVDAKGETQKARPAMFLESEDDLAGRLEGRVAELPRSLFKDLDSDTLALMMVFEYMIGNTDFSIYALHNVRLIQDPGRNLYPVGYDFDYAGLVAAHYAAPAPLLNLKSVEERLYRGPCLTPDELQPIVERFREKQAEVLLLVEQVPGLDSGSRRHAKRYLSEFYEAVADRGGLKRALTGCSKGGM
jgi:hypothetical protein